MEIYDSDYEEEEEDFEDEEDEDEEDDKKGKSRKDKKVNFLLFLLNLIFRKNVKINKTKGIFVLAEINNLLLENNFKFY